MKSTKFPFLALMIKYRSKIMDVMDYILVIRVNYKKTVFFLPRNLTKNDMKKMSNNAITDP